MEAAVENNTPNDEKENAPSMSAGETSKDSTPTPQPPPEHRSKKRREDRNKKEDKIVEQFMKSIDSLPLEEKFNKLHKKYAEMVEDCKKLQFYIKMSDKRYFVTAKDKETLQYELNKAVLFKSKLENLCRELQKQNKAIKEESLLKIREEEERRKETQAKFQATLADITALLQQNNEKNTKLRDDNINMSEKFKSILSSYQLREQQVEKMSKQMALEHQLADTKLQKASLEHQAEKGRLLAEMEQLKMEMHSSKAKIQEMEGVEAALRGQIAVYTEKYDEFQNALVKSNQVFGGFKGEMEKMTKKIQLLEKESLNWKCRWEVSQRALLDMCAERQTEEASSKAVKLQLQHMQALCRTLQAERTSLVNALKENNIERPPLPVLPPLPPAPPAHSQASNNKVDAMAANCAQLKESLAHLQSQLNVLTNKQEEQPKPEKSKKKHKKNKDKKQQDNNAVENETKTEQNTAQNSINLPKEEVLKTDEVVVSNETQVNEDSKQITSEIETNVKVEIDTNETESNATETNVKVEGTNKTESNAAENNAQITQVTTTETVQEDTKQITSETNVKVKIETNETESNATENNAQITQDTTTETVVEIKQNGNAKEESINESLNHLNIEEPNKVKGKKKDKSPKRSKKSNAKVNEKKADISIQEDIEKSFVDPACNDEIAHIDEVKSLTENGTC